MDYYHCSGENLHQEIRRRGYHPAGTIEELGEGLHEDDESRGTCATTVTTENIGYLVTHLLNLPRPAALEQFALAGSLMNQKIVHWTMGTFFPSLQLFFESGLSCTIDAGNVSDATIGIDNDLRFRLADCTHEEDGRINKTPIPRIFENAAKGLVIREAVIARRTSIAIHHYSLESALSLPSSISSNASASIVHEQHTVVGLRIDGMSQMAYVWAKFGTIVKGRNATWVGVGISSARNDVPVPFLGDPIQIMKPGSGAEVVVKSSLISGDTLADGVPDQS